TRKRGVTEIFAAAYILYARYADPFTGKPARLEDTIGLLADLRRHESKAGPARQAQAVGFRFNLWKQYILPRFLGSRPKFAAQPPKEAWNAPVIVWGLKHEELPCPVVR